jgi:hypothetical protein
MAHKPKLWSDGPLRPKHMHDVDRRSLVVLLIDRNPKKGARRERFALYRSGMTVADFIEAVRAIGRTEEDALADLAWDQNQAFIRLDAPQARNVWSVVDAKAKLSEILRLAREGRPQAIGADDPCMVVSASEFERYWRPDHLGKFLIESAPRGIELELPSRADDRSGDVFAADGERSA